MNKAKGCSKMGIAGKEDSYTPEGCVRAINKRAQKRFRDKKKAERESVEQSVAELTSRLTQLEASHRHLKQRNQVLEHYARTAPKSEHTSAAEVSRLF